MKHLVNPSHWMKGLRVKSVRVYSSSNPPSKPREQERVMGRKKRGHKDVLELRTNLDKKFTKFLRKLSK